MTNLGKASDIFSYLKWAVSAHYRNLERVCSPHTTFPMKHWVYAYHLIQYFYFNFFVSRSDLIHECLFLHLGFFSHLSSWTDQPQISPAGSCSQSGAGMQVSVRLWRGQRWEVTEVSSSSDQVGHPGVCVCVCGVYKYLTYYTYWDCFELYML